MRQKPARALGALMIAAVLSNACGGPPSVESREAYAASGSVTAFDHGTLDALLHRHVKPGGYVDYAALAKDSDVLGKYLQTLATADFAALTRDAKLAFLINAYNAFTLRLILDNPKIKSIRDISASKRWKSARWKLAGETVSLHSIEHERIRPKFTEPRIHFALVCAAVGCPPLRAEAYTAAKLEAQLTDQTHVVHSDTRWLRFDAKTGALELTKLYDWYAGDFKASAGSVELFVARHCAPVRTHLDAGKSLDLDWLSYDWSLNSVDNAR